MRAFTVPIDARRFESALTYLEAQIADLEGGLWTSVRIHYGACLATYDLMTAEQQGHFKERLEALRKRAARLI